MPVLRNEGLGKEEGKKGENMGRKKRERPSHVTKGRANVLATKKGRTPKWKHQSARGRKPLEESSSRKRKGRGQRTLISGGEEQGVCQVAGLSPVGRGSKIGPQEAPSPPGGVLRRVNMKKKEKVEMLAKRKEKRGSVNIKEKLSLSSARSAHREKLKEETMHPEKEGRGREKTESLN